MHNLIRKDLRYIWHPYTQMKESRALPPILIEKARGIKLYDDRGNFYYDTISSWWCNVHGHNHPRIKAAIKKQLGALEHVGFAGFTHRPAIGLAERLVSITPRRLTKVFFSDNGSTAVEVALKMSFQYWRNTGVSGKTGFICLERGYHGDTIGAMSVSGIGMFNEMFSPLCFPSLKAPAPYCYRCPMGKERTACAIECAAPLEKMLRERSREVAALIIEPMVMGASGMIVYPAEYLAKVAEFGRRFGVHIIVDEVATGFGRTGKMFASEYVGDFADFMCLSKGITAGYLPLAATLTTDEIYDAFYADYAAGKTFFHGHTYTANPLACAAGIASLEVFEKEKTLRRVQGLMPYFQARLQEFRSFSCVGDVRCIGLIGALELVRDKKTKEPCEAGRRIGLQIYARGLKKNLVLRPLGNVVYFFLPLCVGRTELDDILARTKAVMGDFV